MVKTKDIKIIKLKDDINFLTKALSELNSSNMLNMFLHHLHFFVML